MIKYFKYLLVAGVFASVLVSSRSHFLTLNGDLKPEQFETVYTQFRFGIANAQQRLSQAAVARHDMYWLPLLAAHGDLAALNKLVELTPDPAQQMVWLRQAAQQGDAEAQFRLALEERDPDLKLEGLLASAQLGVLDAQHALVEWYVLNDQVEQAIPWLYKTAQHFASDAFRLAEYLWREKASEDAIKWYERAHQLGHDKSGAYAQAARAGKSSFDNLLQGQHRWYLPGESDAAAVVGDEQNLCQQRILPIARSLANMVQVKSLLDSWQRDARLQSLPICMLAPIWLPESELSCAHTRRASANRMQCDVTPLENLVEALHLTHVIVFNPSNRAYVDAGIMYLDLHDTYSVFVHELAHFVGFADEYPIAKTLAQVHCSNQSAPNLVFEGEISYQPVQRVKEWQKYIDASGGEGIGLYPARSCNNVGIKAYKLTDDRTFLEFHDTDLIPNVYLDIWAQQLATKQHWYPIAENLARHYERQGMYAKASEWRRFADEQQLGSIDTPDETGQPTSR